MVWDYGVRGEQWNGCRLVEGVIRKPSDGEPGPSDPSPRVM